MTALAMSFVVVGVPRTSLCPHVTTVVASRSQEQVIGIDASWGVTPMQDRLIGRDRTIFQLIGNSMGSRRNAINHNAPVSTSCPSGEQQAFSPRDGFLSEPVSQWFLGTAPLAPAWLPQGQVSRIHTQSGPTGVQDKRSGRYRTKRKLIGHAMGKSRGIVHHDRTVALIHRSASENVAAFSSLDFLEEAITERPVSAWHDTGNIWQ